MGGVDSLYGSGDTLRQKGSDAPENCGALKDPSSAASLLAPPPMAINSELTSESKRDRPTPGFRSLDDAAVEEAAAPVSGRLLAASGGGFPAAAAFVEAESRRGFAGVGFLKKMARFLARGVPALRILPFCLARSADSWSWKVTWMEARKLHL